MPDQGDTALVEKVGKAIQQAGLEYKTATGARYTMGTCLANELARAAIAAVMGHDRDNEEIAVLRRQVERLSAMVADRMPETAAIDALAEAWASIDGNLESYRACRDDPDQEREHGRHGGYTVEAEEMIRRLMARGYELRAIATKGRDAS